MKTNETITKELVYTISKASFGMVPGVIKEMAERSAPLAYLYLTGTQIMEQSSFSPVEINAIELKVSLLNKCESCTKGHSFLLKKLGLSDENLQAILRKQNTSNERLNNLLQAAEYIYYLGNGPYPDVAMDFFAEVGLTEQEIVEIIGLISLKTISNYVNNFIATLQAKQPSNVTN